MVTRVPARASVCQQQAPCELAGAGEGKHRLQHKPDSDGGSCDVFPFSNLAEVIFILFIKGLLLLASGWQAIFGCLLHLYAEMGWHRLVSASAWHPLVSLSP